MKIYMKKINALKTKIKGRKILLIIYIKKFNIEK